RIIVGDRARALSVDHHRAGDIGDVDEEGLAGLVHRVVQGGHVEAVGRRAGRYDLAGEALRDVVGARDRGAVGGGDVERHPARPRRHAQADGGGQQAAFDTAGVADRQHRAVVVADGAGGAGRRADRIVRAGGEGDDDGFVGFAGGVGDRRDRDGAGRAAGGDRQGRGRRAVVAARGGGAGQAEGQRQRYGRGLVEGDGIDQIGRAVLVDHSRRYRDRCTGQVVVGDGAGGAGRRADGIAGTRGKADHDRLVLLDHGIGGRQDL